MSFFPIRTIFPPLWWPDLVCPWKSCALSRVRVRVQKSSHPQRSWTESMTLVRLPDFTPSSQLWPSLPTGKNTCQMVPLKGVPQLYSHGDENGATFCYFLKEHAEVLPGALNILKQIIKSTVTSHFQYITPQFLLTPPLWLLRPQTGQRRRHQTEPWRPGRSAGSWKHLYFPRHCAAG